MIEIKKTCRNNANLKILITKLDIELKERYGDSQNEYNKHNIIEDDDTVLIAYYNELQVACGCYKKFNNETVEIKRMFVQKAYRRKGISKLILQELESKAIDEGYKKAILETGINQPAATNLYYSAGYKRIDNYGQYMNRETSICMLKNLI